MKYLLTLGLLGLARGSHDNTNMIYYCSNDSLEHAEDNGGILCPEGPGVTPECPNKKPCLCIDPDGDCNDGDDWGYVNPPPESSASQLSLVMPLATVAIACLSRV